jgi:5-oxoprolinase (ATP-hydrolysing)
MTNTRITDAEVFERRYPVLLREFGLRRGSGGKGRHNGGDGVVRDIEFRIPVTVSILSERRVYHPYGLEGGEEGQCGLNTWVRKVKKPDANADATLTETPNEKAESKKSDGLEDAGGEEVQYRHINMGGKNTAEMKAGERIIVMTPGGGAWGKEGDESAIKEKKDPKHAWRGGSVASRQGTAESSA